MAALLLAAFTVPLGLGELLQVRRGDLSLPRDRLEHEGEAFVSIPAPNARCLYARQFARCSDRAVARFLDVVFWGSRAHRADVPVPSIGLPCSVGLHSDSAGRAARLRARRFRIDACWSQKPGRNGFRHSHGWHPEGVLAESLETCLWR